MSKKTYTYQRKPSEPTRTYLARTSKETGPREGRPVGYLPDLDEVETPLDPSKLNPFGKSKKTPRSPGKGAHKQLATEPTKGRDPLSPVKRDTKSLGDQVTPLTHRARDSGFSGTVLEQSSFRAYRTPTAVGDTESSDTSSSDDVNVLSPTLEGDRLGEVNEQLFDEAAAATDNNEIQYGAEGGAVEDDPSDNPPETGEGFGGEEVAADHVVGDGNDDDDGQDNNQDQFEEEEAQDNQGDSEPDDDMPPKVKIQDPPKFCGGPHEDVIDWIDRYETIGANNGWDDADLRKFFIIYLDGPARQWYQCKHSTLPQMWASTPPVMAGNVVQEAAVKGTKELFLEEFQKGNNKLFMERK